MSLSAGTTITGIEGVQIRRGEDGNDVLVLHLTLSDGGVGATYWELADMVRFVSAIDVPPRRPAGPVQ